MSRTKNYRMACGRCGQLLLKRDGYCPVCQRFAERERPDWRANLFVLATMAAACWLLILLTGMDY